MLINGIFPFDYQSQYDPDIEGLLLMQFSSVVTVSGEKIMTISNNSKMLAISMSPEIRILEVMSFRTLIRVTSRDRAFCAMAFTNDRDIW